MNDVSNKDLGFSATRTSSLAVKPRVDSKADVNLMVTNNNRVPVVPLNSCEVVNGNEQHWLPSFIVDELYLQICETEIEDPQYGGKISRYYLEAAKYAGRIGADNFHGKNVKHKPVFEIHYNDFTPRLQAELLLLKVEVKISATSFLWEFIRKEDNDSNHDEE